MVGGPSQMDLYDYKPKMDEWYDKDLPDSVRMGQRLTTMTSRPEAVPDRPVEVQVRAARPERHVGPRAAALHGQDGRRHVLHPQHAHRGDQPRAGHHATCRPATRSPAGPASGSWASYGLGSLNDNLPTFVVLVAKPIEHRAGPGDLRPALVVRLPARASTPASRSAPAATRSCTSTTRPASRPTSAARRSTASRRSTR